MDQRTKEQRIAQARAEIKKRIARVCRTLPEAEFENLLDRMTAIHCKYDIFPHVPEVAQLAELETAVEEEFRAFKRQLGS